MTETNQKLDEFVNEEKNSEIEADFTFTKPTSDKVHDSDNETGKVIDLESDEMISKLDNQTNPPSNLNKLADDESNNVRQFSPSTTLNESTKSSPEILTILNESNNDKQNNSSNTFDDLSDDKQNSSIIPKDDKQTGSHDDKPNIFNDSEQISSHDDKPIISNYSEQTSSHDDKPNISNDSEQTNSHDDKSNISNDSEQTSSHDDKSNISNDGEQTSSLDDKQISPPNILNDVKQIRSTNISNNDEQINSQIASTISIDENELYDDKQKQTTSNEYLYDDSKESNQPTDTNKDSSKHSSSEDDISSNAIMNESETQQEEEQNQLTGTSIHGNKESFNTSDDEGFEFVQKDKPTDSIDLSKHEINDIDYSFISEVNNNHAESNRPVITEPPFNREYNEDEKLSNDEIVESNSDDNNEYYDDDDSHKESEYTERKEDYKTKEENQLTNTDDNEFKPTQNNTFDYNSYIEPEKNEVQVVDQQIRRRFNQQHQEPSENITSPKRSNVRTDTHHQSIPFFKIFRNILFSILIFGTIYFIYDVSRLAKRPSSLRNIADITDNIFEEINSVDLPAIGTLSDYEIECRRAAITVERCVPFKTHDIQIAKGLNEIKDAISKSRKLLQFMYSKGSTLRSSFESEIEAILQRLDSTHIRHDDARYIRDRLDKLTKKIKDIKISTEKSHNSILDVKKIRTNIDDDIKNGLKDAEKFNKNEKYSSNIVKAKKEIENVDNTLSKLYTNVYQLVKLREILSDYEGKLMGVLNELDELGDRGARILKDDIKHLRVIVENTKVRNHIFNRLANAD